MLYSDTLNNLSVNKAYKAKPPTGEDWYAEQLVVYLEDSGTMDPGDFGAIASGLTNGLSLKAEVGGATEKLVVDIKTNVDLLLSFPDDIVTFPSSTAFLNGEDFFVGSMKFAQPFRLSGDDTDNIKAVVKDDLTGLTMLRMRLKYWRYK